MNRIESVQKRVIACERCPELRAYCAAIAQQRRKEYRDQTYWAKPVPAFGDPRARMVLVGLAPGAHGSNRTGRMFTGDASGNFLFPALHRAGFASQPDATAASDGMRLENCIITAAGRCAPPQNKPTPRQLANCFPYLAEEFDALEEMRVAVGLGAIGFLAAAKALKAAGFAFESKTLPKFAHGAEYIARKKKREVTLLGCYHPSRQNTNTGVLTADMIDAVFERARTIAQAR